MQEVYEYDENLEPVELEGFTSDDGKHEVIWKERWFCETHSKDYYTYCLVGNVDKDQSQFGAD